MTGLALPPLSLYVHVPWCERKCPYCDFNSHQPDGAIPEARYVEALLCDLQGDLQHVRGRSVESIFIGGGTPSLLSVHALEQLLSGLREALALAPDCEITLEANPGSAEADKFAGFVSAGINRISIGVQSFDDNRLAALGRIHNSRQAEYAVGAALESGARAVNIDLMHGLPGQDVESAVSDLQRAIDLAPDHLSWYQLTIEKNTAFYKRPPQLPPESLLGTIQDRGEQLLADAGYTQYEVSAYCRQGMQCRHNLNYWHFGDYLGIGAGAHGKLTAPEDGRIHRTVKRRQPLEYLAATPDFHAPGRDVPAAELPGDFMLNALRLREGFAPALFESRTGLNIDVLSPTCDRLEARGLLEVSPTLLRPSSLGWRFLDDVVAEFL